MTAMLDRGQDTSVVDAVDAIIPRGDKVQLPADWFAEFSAMEQRKESPSSIRTFLGCPLRWYLERYVDLGSGEPSFGSSVGSFVHRVLEVFYSEPAPLRTPRLLTRTFNEAWNVITQRKKASRIIPADLQAEFIFLRDQADNKDGFQGGFYKKARAAVEAIEDFDGDPSQVKVVSTETWVRTKINGIMIRGKIDRIESSPIGGERIQDYKGLALDTPIPTPGGWTTMGELQPGDQVMGRNGLPTTVTVKSAVHNRPCYRITFLDGSSIVCDNVHLWQVAGVGHYPLVEQVLGADELYHHYLQAQAQKGSRKRSEALVIQNPSPLQLPEIDLSIHPWVLGAWLGDGTAKEGSITVGAQDWVDMMSLVKEYWQGDCQYWEPVPGGSGYISLRGEGWYTDGMEEQPRLTHLLRAQGVLRNKHIPVHYLRASRQQRLLLLQGLMDTDGHWHRSRDRAVFMSTNPALAEGVAELVASLGVTPATYRYSYTNPVRPAAVTHQVWFTPVEFNPFLIPRKADQVDEWASRETFKGYALRRAIVAMEPVDSVPTQCIQVDAPDSLYLAGPMMTPTHNTGRLPSDDEPIDVLSDNYIALGLYALMRSLGADGTGLDAKVVTSAQLLFLAHHRKYTIRVKEDVLAKTHLMASRVTEMMNDVAATGDIIASPGEDWDSGSCFWCPARYTCPVWTDGTFTAFREAWEV